MAERVKIAIVGSGPGGLSAAARAAERGLSHVLLEAEPHLSNTIFRYQKGKHVMDEPGILPLRSPLPFTAGTREAILEAWNQGVAGLGVTVRHGAEVTRIEKQPQGHFVLTVKSGAPVEAEHVVMGIGLQGNIRKLGVPGEDLPFVQYQLDDPDEYSGETIVVVGAGDAAIENAIALSRNNEVVIVNRRDEFARAKEGNLRLVLKAIEDGSIQCYYNAAPEKVEALSVGRKPGRLTLATPNGRAQIMVDRVIGRLGATAPRGFVESCGIVFPSKDPAAVPAISATYESNVPGLYIVGALGGYPLIKQAMNQGFEVVEYILGGQVEPADEPLLREKFRALPGFTSVDAALARIQRNVRLLSHITPLQLREFMLDSDIRTPRRGEVVFQRNDYTNTFFSIVEGTVEVVVNAETGQRIVLQKGEFFGEMSLISGRRRSATVHAGEGCVLVETPRRSMNRLINSVEAVKREIDLVFITRAIQQRFAPTASAADLADVAGEARIERFAAGDVLFNEGDEGDCLHLVRVGSLTISRNIGGREVVLSYVPAGNYVGEMALLGSAPRSATARAAIATETIRLDAGGFKRLMAKDPVLRLKLQQEYRQRTAANLAMQNMPSGGDVISFLIGQGVGEATDVLLIDESLCVRCDNCEKACAETHGGTSRLDREAGPTYGTVHVPTSCRHCEHPHCMKDCPPDAIHRAPNGEVFIADNCIGCGNCERNCPYGVIHMSAKKARKPGLLSWLLFGAGPGPGESPYAPDADPMQKKAVKCDMCKGVSGGPACVASCPTGAAVRISPEELIGYAQSRGGCWSCPRLRPGSRGVPGWPDHAATPRSQPWAAPTLGWAGGLMHASFLTYANKRWLWVALLLAAACLLAYGWHDPVGAPPNGGTWLGYTLGSIGALLILWLLWFGIRKRRYGRGIGPVRGWLSAHVYLGTALVLVALLHSGFQVGWNVHTLALVLMMAVILSGFVGVYGYLRYPTLMTRNRDNASREAMLEEIAELDQNALALADAIDPKIHAIVLRSVDRTRLGGGVWSQLTARDASDQALDRLRAAIAEREKSEAGMKTGEQPTMFAMVDFLAAKATDRSSETIRKLIDLLSRKKVLATRVARDIQLQALMEFWLYVHVPLSIALLAALVAHVVSVFFYW